MNNFGNIEGWVILLIAAISIWDLVWKLIALWKSARRDQTIWFVFLGIVNSAGILPIIYLLIYRAEPEKIADTSANQSA